MKLALSWLADWVDWPTAWDAAELARRLTSAGFEVEALSPAAPPFERVIVARISAVEPHPQADRLRVCRVEIGASSVSGTSSVQIVCGAANARVGLVSALAQMGARLPGDKSIGAAKLRGVESQGMLCSARELGLSEASEGILELPADAPVGEDLRRYLNLDDVVLDVNVTANRGDAMSVLGLAREVAALSGSSLKIPHSPTRIGTSTATSASTSASTSTSTSRSSATGSDADHFGVSVQPGSGAARLLVALLRGADNTRPTPLWMRERLRRVGLRCISAVVDVTNYVMLELGQPLHAYDRSEVRGGLDARRALAGERLTLLDGREIELSPDVLLIADEQRPLGLAGVMGGQGSAISPETRDVVLEVAWFAPAAIAGRARRFGLVTDASQRFERGVDWRGQERALERAVSLLAEITGAVASAPRLVELPAELPAVPTVTLRAKRLQRLLGVNVEASEIERRLGSLAMRVSRAPTPATAADAVSAVAGTGSAVWHVQPPSWRFDIAIEADLIEEIARLRGLDVIAEADAPLPVRPRAPLAGRVDAHVVMRTLAARGYQEIITYAFVDPALQRTLLGEVPTIELANPIASDLSVMRASLWPGLVQAARENLRRQQPRVRLFELATQFERSEPATTATPTTTTTMRGASASPYRERRMLAGLVLGARLPEQWGSAAAPVDFFDVKGDLQALLALSSSREELSFEAAADILCLHPGRSAHILRAGRRVGRMGELHPGLLRAVDLGQAPLLFELDYEQAFAAQVVQFREVSRFPRIRRDISVTIPEQTAFAAVRERVTVAAARLLKELLVFDIYHGDGVESGRKSLALGLILQDLDRTLTDEDADRTVRAVLDDLQAHLGARIREQRQP